MDLDYEDTLPIVDTYVLSNKTSSGNIRLQSVISTHDEASNVHRNRISITLDTNNKKEAKKVATCVTSYIKLYIQGRLDIENNKKHGVVEYSLEYLGGLNNSKT